jgi:hypothetical protein
VPLHNFREQSARKEQFGIRSVALSSLVHLSSNNHLPQLFSTDRETILTRNRSKDTLFVDVAFVPVISSPEQYSSLRRSSITLSFQATETIFTGIRTHDILTGFRPVFL